MGFLSGVLEKRSAASDFDAWVKKYIQQFTTSSGVVVNETTAMNCAVIWACVKIISEDVAKLPLLLYKRDGDRKRRATEHSLYDVLHNQANPYMTDFEYRETITGHLALRGNAFSFIERDGAGDVIALWPLRPDRMTVSQDKDGKLWYDYVKTNGQPERYSPDKILHIRTLSGDGLIGYSPITQARHSIGLALAAEKYGASFFANDARPSIVLKHPASLSEDAQDRLRNGWSEQYGGPNRGKPAVLEEGLDIASIGMSNDDAQFLGTREFQVVEMCRWYRMQPHKVMHLLHATYSNIEHQNIEYHQDTMMPYLVRIEKRMGMSLLTVSERREGYYVEHLVEGLLRGDTKTRYDSYAVARQNGWMSANDIRRLENMDPVDGGDVYLVPLNMIPAEQAAQGLRPVSGQTASRSSGSSLWRERLAASYIRLFADAVRRIVRREVVAIKREAHKRLAGRGAPDFLAWLEDFYGEHPEYVRQQMNPVLMSYAESIRAVAAMEVNSKAEMTPELEDLTRRYSESFARSYVDASLKELRALLESPSEEELVELIVQRMDEWDEARPDEMASREVVQFGNAVTQFTFKEAGIAAA